MTPSQDALNSADEIIEELELAGHTGYQVYRDRIARELYDEGLWQGNWDTSIHFDDLQDLRLIEENEYDQSMDEDEKPEWEDMISQVRGGYLFFA